MPDRKRVVIVGGVAGGASAAARVRRLSEEAHIVLLERGPHVSFANCGLPYHIGGAIEDREKLLVQTPESLERRFRIDVRVRSEAVAIDREKREVTVRDLAEGRDYVEPYDALVLSPGAEPVRPPIDGVDSERVLTLRNLEDMDRIVSAAPGASRAVVVGGGYIGLEMAEALRECGIEVTLVELLDQVMGPADPEMAAPLHQQLRLHGVDLRLGTSVTAFREEGDGLRVELSQGEPVACAFAMLAIGVRPDSALARAAGLEVSERGAIVVDDHMRTSDPAIYAVGDAVQVTDLVSGQPTLLPLAGPANRQGRIAADNICGRDSTYRHTQGTAICKVFDLAIGMTGMNEKGLRKAGRSYEKIYVHPMSHASYYPGAVPLSLKLLFDPGDGRILGAQAVGADGVDKRIDVLATAIRSGLTVYDLEHLELAYAPPYGSAKDPVNYAGFVAANALRGDVRLCHADDCDAPTDAQVLLDVRTPAEVEAGTLPGAMAIPLDDLRDRLEELPRDKELLVFCQAGLRGYIACRILAQNGFQCRNLTGGYKTYTAAKGLLPNPEPKKMTQPPADRAADAAEPVKTVDAKGLQCPGPILKLKEELESLEPGQSLAIDATDPGFLSDAPAWCRSTGNTLVGVEPQQGGVVRAVVAKGGGQAAAVGAGGAKEKTIVVFSNDLDRAMAAFIIANGAAAMGSQVTLFFTFWGLNILRRPDPKPVKKNLVERMFGWMMPKGARKLSLSKMHMAGLGTAMMKRVMRSQNVASLPDLIESAQAAGVRLVACTMTMGVMGIRHEELIDGVEEGGVAMYLAHAEAGTVNLFI